MLNGRLIRMIHSIYSLTVSKLHSAKVGKPHVQLSVFNSYWLQWNLCRRHEVLITFQTSCLDIGNKHASW